MGDLSSKDASASMKIVGADEQHEADVELLDGKKRLHTLAQVSSIPVESSTFIWFSSHLKNGGSFEANVDGSSTPVDFTAGPGAGKVWYVTRLAFSILDNGSMSNGSFGVLSALGDPGLEFFIKRNSVEHRIVRVRDNFELSSEFTSDSFSPSGGAGFMNEDDFFKGDMIFPSFVKLDGDNGDQVIMRVNDDLTAIDRMASRIIYGEGF